MATFSLQVFLTLNVKDRSDGFAALSPHMIDRKFQWTYQQLPDSIGCGDVVDVIVPQVYAPDFFFVQ